MFLTIFKVESVSKIKLSKKGSIFVKMFMEQVKCLGLLSRYKIFYKPTEDIEN